MVEVRQSAFEHFPFELILASSSPRRQELLKHLGLPFIVRVPGVEEKHRPGEAPDEYVQRNALEKAQAVLETLPHQKSCFVIGADTVVVLNDKILEKPSDAADATRMLLALSGLTHEVLTGIAVVYAGGEASASERMAVRTKVQFKVLSPHEIAYYIKTGEPLDKAGAYGIQGIGGFLVERVEGSFSNVVGLPLVELSRLLHRLTDLVNYPPLKGPKGASL